MESAVIKKGYTNLCIGDLEMVIDKHFNEDGLNQEESILESQHISSEFYESSHDEKLFENDDIIATRTLHDKEFEAYNDIDDIYALDSKNSLMEDGVLNDQWENAF